MTTIRTLFIPATLAEVDAGDVVKIAIFAIAGLVWVVAQVGSAAKSKAKKNTNRMRAEIDRDDFEEVDAPPPTRLDRQLERRRQQAEHFRETGRRDVPAAQPVQDRPQTYEELRRARLDPAPPPPPVQKPRLPQPKRPPAKPQPAPVIAAATVVKGEIGGDASPAIGKRRGGRGGVSHHSAVAALLRRGSLRDVIAASEILQPPVALRRGEDGRPA